MSEPTTLEEMRAMVEIPEKNYSIGKYQVTQALWESVLGNNPSHFKGSSRPVEKVSWFDCVAFCNKLSEIEGLDEVYLINGEEVACNLEADGYRLPTEWEWYFAATANQTCMYAGSDHFEEVAWTRENSDGETHPVGQKQCNGFGLFDMSGNVNEWCWDWHGDETPTEDNTGPSSGLFRVLRGSSFDGVAMYSGVALTATGFSYRFRGRPSGSGRNQGFRLARTVLLYGVSALSS